MKMKKIHGFMLASLLVMGLGAPTAKAAVFSNTLNYGSGITILETLFNFNAAPTWTHNINGSLGGNSIHDVTILDAVLTLNFSGTSGSLVFGFIPNPELWSIDGLGFLNVTGNTPINQAFAFDAAAIADLSFDGLFTAVPREWTLNLTDLASADRFTLLSSTLSGNYSVNQPVVAPEPATFALLGIGLAMGALVKRKRTATAQ